MSMPCLSVMKCDCCNNEKAIGVCSSGLGPMSFAFCVDCLQKPAEPIIMFVYIYDMVSHEGEGLREEINDLYTWKDGKYISWKEYVEYRHSDIGKAENADSDLQQPE